MRFRLPLDRCISVGMGMWDAYSAMMDGPIDAHLGDTLSYAVGRAGFKPVQGFVINAAEAQNGDSNYLDPILGVRHRVKIAKTTLIMQDGDRVQHPKLGKGIWKIMGPEDDEATQGRYMIADVQKAGA